MLKSLLFILDKKSLSGAGMWLLVTAILTLGVIVLNLIFNWIMNQVRKFKNKRKLKNKLND